MKKLITLSLSVGLAAALGCSGDDPIGPTPTPPPRLVVTTGTAAPSLTSVSDAIWNGAPTTAVEIATAIAPQRLVRDGLSLSDSVWVQAIRYNDSLYLRVQWTDATHSILKDPYAVSVAGPPPQFVHDVLNQKEDHLFVMVSGLAAGAYDTWHWRSLTTAYAFLAEGQSFDGVTLTADGNNPNMRAAYENSEIGAQQPTVVHVDTSAFTGMVMYFNETVLFSGSVLFSGGWTIGQTVPGWRIDSTLYLRPTADRQSRWDIRSIFAYDSGTNQYTVVMCRAMNTGAADDVDLTLPDSVQIKLGLLDNTDDIGSATSRRGFTADFWMKL